MHLTPGSVDGVELNVWDRVPEMRMDYEAGPDEVILRAAYRLNRSAWEQTGFDVTDFASDKREKLNSLIDVQGAVGEFGAREFEPSPELFGLTGAPSPHEKLAGLEVRIVTRA